MENPHLAEWEYQQPNGSKYDSYMAQNTTSGWCIKKLERKLDRKG